LEEKVYPRLLKKESKFLLGARQMWKFVHPKFTHVEKGFRRMSRKGLTKKLVQVGLAGHQLRAKSSWMKTLVTRIEREWRSLKSSKLLVRLLKSLLMVINSFLGSLAVIVKGIDPIKEFKEYLESGLELL